MTAPPGYVDAYREQGFAVVRQVFNQRDIAELSQACDDMKAAGACYERSFRHGNVLYVIKNDPTLGRVVQFLQWPSYVHPVLARYRTDGRLLRVLEPLIGRDLKQLTNSLIWKPPGRHDGHFAYHQDSRFRRPASAFRNVETSLVQCAVAIDPQRPENGCLRICRGSHRYGDLGLGLTASVFEKQCDDSELRRVGLDPAAVVDVLLDPGDMAIWHPYTVHGSRPNASADDRRSYVNAYMVARDCDRGEWAFRAGQPCQLGEPALVQYEDLYVRPEPHYVDGPPHPFKAPSE